MNRYPRERSIRNAPTSWGFLVLLVSLSFLLLAVGCGGKKPAETDPTDLEPAPEDTMEDVDLGEDPMGGAATDEGAVVPEDVQDPSLMEPAVVLQDVFFDFDKFDLDPEDRDALEHNSQMLRENPSVDVLIEGHCDERGTIQYNLALGEKRANETRSYLVSLGISPERIDVVSYGKERPFVLGHDEASWSQNRRAHFVVQ